MENYSLPGQNESIAGLFDDKESAEKAYYSLKAKGYKAGEINVLMSKETQVQYYSDIDSRNSSRKKDSIECGIGDDFSSFGTNLKIPWPGLVVSGPMENDFNIYNSNSSFTIIEAVIKAGIPKDEVVRFVEGLKDGKILITINGRQDINLNYLSQNQNSNISGNVFY